MKEILSRNDREFVLSSIEQRLRLDGRRLNDMRSIKISFGKSSGMVEVQLGRTRVYTTVTCEVSEPKPERPNEGFFMFSTEISPMASVSVDSTRSNPAEIELGRLIERGLKESRAIDTESLCIVAGSKVWTIRTNVHVLDDCGNLLDCASISVITALLHFRKPDVTVVGNEATIHPIEEREPVPLSIHHTPISITFGFFPKGAMIVDPESREEQVMDGKLSFLVNVHKEICGVSKGGGMSTTIEQVIKCSKIAIIRTAEVTQQIREALHQNVQARSTSGSHLRRKSLPLEIVEHTVPTTPPSQQQSKPQTQTTTQTQTPKQQPTQTQPSKKVAPAKAAPAVTKTDGKPIPNALDVLMKDSVNQESMFSEKNTWDDDNNDHNAMQVDVQETNNNNKKNVLANNKKQTMVDSDSEEEDVVVMTTTQATQVTPTPAPTPAPPTKQTTSEPSIDEEESEDLSVALLKKKPSAKKKAATGKK
ncbi:hypothetical protein SAMD00019534_029280 [Acytostelium subglobosum LB1]|uniref:hypothetical protein n=1 Tax=Acytostelium subglobosum LB1 TaxID=1410327 RepID=UPI000644AACE|nr:hypothetical protein SAMD00019534_029280 [Acytostelium subglobosum LB1]GAM19753.1 hypothetical protein SAMD00019534_029280 [Acytostelium subglobosum LB1]|eukprot:XP_012756515.1 hypothetical protein SAMD00019534_029280 [Acytostelium subglobosum LB1]